MIYLIITTSINNKEGVINDEHRKNRYIDCIQSTLSLIANDESVRPIIVENNGDRETYLNNFNCDVIYTNNNMLNVQHKGVTELLDIKHVINQYNIGDDDIIIKLTGRYKILDKSFFNLVKNNYDKYDAFCKFYNVCTLQYEYDDCVLGLVALKCKYLKIFKYICNQSPEIEIGIFIRENVKNFLETNHLNLECCFADDLRILNV